MRNSSCDQAYASIGFRKVLQYEITRIRLAVMQTLVIFLYEYKEY